MVLIGWTYFSGAVNLSYLYYIDPGTPGEIEWVRRVEYLPLLVLLAAALILKGSENRQAASIEESSFKRSGGR